LGEDRGRLIERVKGGGNGPHIRRRRRLEETAREREKRRNRRRVRLNESGSYSTRQDENGPDAVVAVDHALCGNRGEMSGFSRVSARILLTLPFPAYPTCGQGMPFVGKGGANVRLDMRPTLMEGADKLAKSGPALKHSPLFFALLEKTNDSRRQDSNWKVHLAKEDLLLHPLSLQIDGQTGPQWPHGGPW